MLTRSGESHCCAEADRASCSLSAPRCAVTARKGHLRNRSFFGSSQKPVKRWFSRSIEKRLRSQFRESQTGVRKQPWGLLPHPRIRVRNSRTLGLTDPCGLTTRLVPVGGSNRTTLCFRKSENTEFGDSLRRKATMRVPWVHRGSCQVPRHHQAIQKNRIPQGAESRSSWRSHMAHTMLSHQTVMECCRSELPPAL